MITTAILNVLIGFINWAVSLLPLVATDNPIATAIATGDHYIASVGQVFPIETLIEILSFVLVFDAAWILYQVVRWVYQKIPGIN